ncbi:adhesion regulating molecule [Rhizopus microsporus var. microsporus]|uniref:Adhesion regulating molecule n=1 Tax=Rhizopus microsporus var. microsporus TaxID=86635 RepID=A0A1X0QZ83_RHIZD|nr:adhesion regulating molecule [Rhizopus microsporus var. microsporus]
MSLFPTAQRNNYLVEFNAGKCIREGTTIKPDTRKGVIYLEQDFIIFPEEAEFIRVEQCTTGRVYVLKFKSSNQKQFYWMQSKSDEKDSDIVRRVNQVIDDPSSAAEQNGFDNSAQSDFMQILSGGGQDDLPMSQENLLQFIQNASGLGSSLSRQAEILTSSRWNQLKEKLDRISAEEQAQLDIGDVLNTDTVNIILRDDDIRNALFPFVSATDSRRTPEQVQQLVQNQQFQNRLQTIHKAIQQDELNSILEDLHAEKNLKSFLKAVEDQAKRKHEDAMEEDL